MVNKESKRNNKNEPIRPRQFRSWIQGLATFVTNIHLPNFFKGTIYEGAAKTVCVPGLNCYSCPGATGACPIGSFQAVVGSSKFNFAYYVTGLMILFGVLTGRLICGFLCPFGWFQDLLNKIPSKKFSTEKLKALRITKYIILFGVVWFLTAVVVTDTGIVPPYFCKYVCPQGILEGGIPLSIANPYIRQALGVLFTWKFAGLMLIIILSIYFYRPFCKWICPLGAFYALFNKVSFYKIHFNKDSCIACGKCKTACKMDVDIRKTQDALECIRCNDCVNVCPTDALSTSFENIKIKRKE